MAQDLVLQWAGVGCYGEKTGCNACCNAKWCIFHNYYLIGGKTTAFQSKEIRVGVGLATLYVETAYDVSLGKQTGKVALYAVKKERLPLKPAMLLAIITKQHGALTHLLTGTNALVDLKTIWSFMVGARE